MKHIQTYFISGLLFLIPLWILYIIVKSLAGLVGTVISLPVMLSFILSLIIVTILGFAVHQIFKRYLRRHLDRLSNRPGILGFCVKTITTLDDVADKAREAFTNPVLYKVDDGIYKLGFITDHDMDILGQPTMQSKNEAQPTEGSVWVYAPQPITMMGDFILVESRKIQPLNNQDTESIPLFVMTAGLIEKTQ